MKKVFSSTLRAGTLALKFAILAIIAATFSLEQTGIFILYHAGMLLASSLIPLDIYTHTARQILSDRTAATYDLTDHFSAILLVSVMMAPLASVLFTFFGPDISVALSVIFFFHIIFEAIGNDIGRLLPPNGRPLLAAKFTFFRNAIWIIPSVILLKFDLLPLDVMYICVIWFVGASLSCVLGGLLIFRGNVTFKSLFRPKLNWILNAIRASSLIFLGSILYRATVSIDRFLIENMISVEVLAIYGLYGSVAFAVLSLLEAGVSMWYYPPLVAALQNGCREEIANSLKKFVVANSFSAFILCTGVAFSFALYANYALPDVYRFEINSFYLMMFSVFIFCLSVPFHYVIYGLGKDRILLFIAFISLTFMLTWGSVFLSGRGLWGGANMFGYTLTLYSVLRITIGAFFLRPALLQSANKRKIRLNNK